MPNGGQFWGSLQENPETNDCLRFMATLGREARRTRVIEITDSAAELSHNPERLPVPG